MPDLDVNGDPNLIPGPGAASGTNPKNRGPAPAKGSSPDLDDGAAAVRGDISANAAAPLGFELAAKAQFGTGDKNPGPR